MVINKKKIFWIAENLCIIAAWKQHQYKALYRSRFIGGDSYVL